MPPEPEVLYHYTSPAGFLGIIDSKTIWATGAEHLNDSQEVLHAIKIAQGLLPEFESEHPAVPVVRDLLENRLEEGLRRIYVASWAGWRPAQPVARIRRWRSRIQPRLQSASPTRGGACR